MEIEFDPAKEAENRRKHGASLALVGTILDHLVDEEPDNRMDYGEERWIAAGFVGAVLHVLVTSPCGANRVRSISVRRATKWEVRKWLSSE